MNTKTLHSSHSVVANHLKLIESNYQVTLQAAYELSANDCFSINRLLDAYPNKPTVIDCTAKVTQGATTALLLAHPNVQQVITAKTLYGETIDPKLGQILAESDFANVPAKANKLRLLETPLSDNKQWQKLLEDIPPLSPVVFILHPEQDLEVFSKKLRFLVELHGDPTILLTPVGWLGSSGLLQQLILECRASQREISLMREISPFLGESQLAIIWHQEQYYIRNVVKSIHREFKGNYDFLSLLDDKLSADERIRELEQELCNLRNTHHLQATAQEAQPIPAAESQNTNICTQTDSTTALVSNDLAEHQATLSRHNLKRVLRKIIPQKIRIVIFKLRQLSR